MEAIEKVKRREYDIVFMDHMMPDMDGIEATAEIRDWERQQQENGSGRKPVPIIALTANAVSGMKEMFLEKGFNDFLAKPIDVPKLDIIMGRWIREEKKVREENRGEENKEEEGFLDTFSVDGLDLQAGKNRYHEKPYLEILRAYYTHTPAILEKLRYLTEKPLSEGSISDYIITVHGLKGSSYGICAEAAAKQAEALENAARNRDIERAKTGTAPLIETVGKLLQDIGALLEKTSAAEPAKPQAASPDKALLAEFLEACKHYRTGVMEETLVKLEGYEYESGGGLVAWLRKQADDLEYDAIRERLEKELL
jgi:CheY-like chemotaxis protein